MTTWVLLRGLMREARHWGEFPQSFQQALRTQNIVMLDFPGNGRLHGQSSLTSVKAMADNCRVQLKHMGYRPPYHVLALSLGAMVAAAWSETHPEEIERMVLINTSLAPFSPFYQRLHPRNYLSLLGALLHNSAAQREDLVMRMTSNLASQSEHKQAIVNQWIAYAHEYPVTRTNFLRQLQAAIHYRAAPIAPSVPTLLIAAQQDQLVDVKCTLALAQHWHCPVRLHPTAGHDLPLDDGAWVIQQIQEWLAA